MRFGLTVGLWFLAGWVSYAMAAFALDLPSQATLFVAAGTAILAANVLGREAAARDGREGRRVSTLPNTGAALSK